METMQTNILFYQSNASYIKSIINLALVRSVIWIFTIIYAAHFIYIIIYSQPLNLGIFLVCIVFRPSIPITFNSCIYNLFNLLLSSTKTLFSDRTESIFVDNL